MSLNVLNVRMEEVGLIIGQKLFLHLYYRVAESNSDSPEAVQVQVLAVMGTKGRNGKKYNFKMTAISAGSIVFEVTEANRVILEFN